MKTQGPNIRYNHLLIDGSDLMYRSYFALPALSGPGGMPTSAITGMLNALDRLHKEFQGTFWIIFDPPTRNHRHELFPEYKQHRKPMPEDLKVQWPVAIELLIALGYPVIQKPGYEADDVIASLARAHTKHDHTVLIVSHDKDIMQLVDERTHVYHFNKKKIMNTEAVQELWGLNPKQLHDYLALVGDHSDGFPGVAGVGPKTAVKWLQAYGNLEALWQAREHITGKVGATLKASQAILERNFELARLIDTIPLEEISVHSAEDKARAEALFEQLGMHKRIEKKHSLPEHARHSWQTRSTPREGARYWHLEEHRDNYTLVLWHAEGAWSLIGSEAEVTQVLNNLEWTGDDYWWDTHPVYRLGIMLPDRTGDVSLRCYARDSGHRWPHPLDAWHHFCPHIPNYAEMNTLTDATTCAVYAAYALSQLLAFTDETEAYTEIERPLVKILASMERRGILVSQQALETLSAQMLESMQGLEKEIHASCGYALNILSPQQLRVWLYDELKIPTSQKTGTGQWSTSEETLSALQEEYPILKSILAYRMYAKLRATYCDGLRAQSDALGRVHSYFDQKGTITGRLSSRNPNVQNIPIRTEEGRWIRSAFCATPGHVLLSADYSQIELRIMAHLAQETEMLHILNTGGDIHQQTAAWVFECPPSSVTEEQRRFAKTINFGLLYGMSAYGLAQALNIEAAQSKMMIERYFEAYPGLKAYRERLIQQAHSEGCVYTVFGRRISLERNVGQRGWMERLALNAPMQGSASDIIKKAMVALHTHLSTYDAFLLLQVHDELVLEVPEAQAEALARTTHDIMTHIVKLSVPLNVTVKIGKNWGDMNAIIR